KVRLVFRVTIRRVGRRRGWWWCVRTRPRGCGGSRGARGDPPVLLAERRPSCLGWVLLGRAGRGAGQQVRDRGRDLFLGGRLPRGGQGVAGVVPGQFPERGGQ